MDDFIQLIIIGIVFIIIILLAVVVYMYLKDKSEKRSQTEDDKQAIIDEQEEKRAQKSIFKFMEFDNIEDNMIVQDGGKRYLMVIECKGVNYDLLSGIEKNSVEQGFIEFLNALKFEIQLYVQTRKVNLAQSTMKYRERLKTIELDMRNEEARYQDMQRMGNYTKDEILKELKEVTKKRNLYEYGKDIIENTEQMSADSDLTTKEYYIVVPYYTDEITSAGDYDKKEIGSMAFTELYTRAQSLVNALGACNVRGKILNSQQLIELLFIAYNREQHDTYDFEEYMSQSGFNSFYSVSESVLEKRMVAINEEILKKADEKAVEAYQRVNKRVEARRRAIKEREERIQEYIDSTANEIIDSQKNVIGDTMASLTKDEVKRMTEESEKRKQREDNLEDEQIITKEEETKPKKRELTEEEKRRRRILKKRRLLKEKEAQKNGKK